MKPSGLATDLECKSLSRDGRCIASRLIISCGDDGVAKDYCQFLDNCPVSPPMASTTNDGSERTADGLRLRDTEPEFQRLTAEEFAAHSFDQPFCPDEIVVFLEPAVTARTLRVFATLSKLVRKSPVKCLVVVPSLWNHLADDRDDKLKSLLDQLGGVFRRKESRNSTEISNNGAMLVIIRTGYILSPSSSLTRRLRFWSGFQRLLLDRITTTFLDCSRLFPAINDELNSTLHPNQTDEGAASSSVRQITLLGTRRSWKEMISASNGGGTLNRAVDMVARVMALVGLPWILFTALRLFSLLSPSLRQLHFETLKPGSARELLSLYNRHNCNDIQIAGYNNGVNHFGWKFPGKTVVLTTGLPGRTHLSDTSILDLESRLRESVLLEPGGELPKAPAAKSGTHFTVDAGLTLNHCIRELNKLDREFYVVPNYSWISMGTLFFVPVHGSGSHVSTLGDTIEDVLFYDGDEEQFVLARRGDAIFCDSMYNTSRHLLLLRLTLRVKQKSKYFVRRSSMENPSAEEVLQLFDDKEASNVEIRKNKAASSAIDVSRYFIDSVADGQDTMEMPRDSIGRVWDRLEETPVVSTLFHWFVRKFAFHVELFLKPDEFAIFWEHHRSLPVSKIQLRRVLKDGMTHSACEHHDCISADLFMTRRNRDVFCKFVASHLPNVRSNPGKQSL